MYLCNRDFLVPNEYEPIQVVHTGQLIQSVLHQQGKTVTWFAQQLCCTRTNVYKIFQKQNLDIEIIWRASCILKYDFFQALSAELTKLKEGEDNDD